MKSVKMRKKRRGIFERDGKERADREREESQRRKSHVETE